jgi:hypothetical protein
VTEVRRLQRALFRMLHDAEFAARVRAGDAEAAASTGLGPSDLAGLRGADPAAIAADRDGRRGAQLLRNVTSEFPLCVAAGPRADGDDAWTPGFPRSAHFHRAVSEDEPLPLAFAAFAEATARDAKSALFRAFVALEAEMARARRAGPAPVPALAAGEVALTGWVRLLALPAGTHAAAVALGEALAAGGAGAARVAALEHGLAVDTTERLLVVADACADARFGRLRPVRVEPLPPLVAAFLEAARAPLAPAARRAFAAAHDVDAAEMEAVVDEYVAEGVLARGPAPGGATAG